MKNYLTYFIIFSIVITARGQITTSEIKVEETNQITSIMGSLGVGVTNPSRKLHVNELNGTIQMHIGRSGNNVGFVDFGADGDGLHFWVNGFDGFGFEELFIGNNGFTGIGTSTPSEKLEVTGRVQMSGSDDDNLYFDILGSNGRIAFLGDGGGGSDGQLALFSSSGGSLAVLIQGSNSSYINTSGNFGIGTNAPSEKLHVNGKIRATGQEGWSDFVFNQNYELPSLLEVDEHIKSRGHLKDIPSEEEVIRDGYNLGEMDAKLLQKIEELTLYMIDMNKRVSQLEQENSELKESNQELKEEISTFKNN